RQVDGRPRLDLSESAAKILLTDAQDRLSFRLDAADGTLLGGDATIPRATPPTDGEPRFYEDQLHGEPVRMIAARMPIGEAPGAPLVQVQVAETLNKRTRLAFEMLANVVVPQLLLIVM